MYTTPRINFSLPPSCTARASSTKYPPLYPPSSTSYGGGKEGDILDERDFYLSQIPKRGSTVPGYESGRLPIFNINGDGNTTEVSDI